MKTLLTGAHGIVGTAVTEHSDTTFTLLDREAPPPTLPDGTPHPHSDHDTLTVDVSDSSSLREAVEGHDRIVHLAGAPSPEAPYETVERNNVRGTYNVLEAAREADIGTVVFASSNHVVGMYEKEHAPEIYGPDHDLVVDHETPVRPDSHYGSSKAAGEAWGRQYADLYGIRFYALRFGSIRPPTWDHPYGDAEAGVQDSAWERDSTAYRRQVARLKCTWQSRRDCAHMVEQCLEDSTVEFDIYYGVSDNSNSWFDIEHAHDRIDYDPSESGDAEIWDRKYGPET